MRTYLRNPNDMTGKTHTPESQTLRKDRHIQDDVDALDMSMDANYRNSGLRRFIHTLASATTQHPIESITLCLIFASFSYFTLFNTIRHSTFFDINNVVVYQPATVIAHPGLDQFLPFDRRTNKIPRNAQQLQLKQVLVTVDPSAAASLVETDTQETQAVTKSALSSVLQLQSLIEDQVLVSPLQLWDRDMQNLVQDGKVLATLTENVETLDYLFKDLRSTTVASQNDSSNAALVLSYAFDANGPFQSRLAQAWEAKVAHLQTPTMKSQSKLLQDEKSALAWVGAALLDVSHKIQGLVQVCYLSLLKCAHAHRPTRNHGRKLC